MKFAAAALLAVLASSAQAKTIEVKMLNAGKDGPMVFEPGFVQADVGDTVKFVAADKAHNSKAIFVPAGAKAWDGKADEGVSVKLDKEGIYIYQCTPHAVMAMAGVIQVGKATNLDAAKAEGEKLSASFVMNKDRLKKYLSQAK